MDKSITKKICRMFINEPSINPITGKRIKKDGFIYDKLRKACDRFKLEMKGGNVPHITLQPQEAFLADCIFSREVVKGTVINARETFVTHHDLMSLQDRIWINDGIIDFCMAIFQDNDDKVGGSSIFLPCRAWNTVNKCDLDNIIKGCIKFKSTQNITRYVFPVNIDDNHWILVQADCHNKNISVYDSLSFKINPETRYTNILQTIGMQIKYFNGLMVLNNKSECQMSNWNILYLYEPRQDNDYDCGVFVILSADCLSRNASCQPQFKQGDINIWRRKILYTILTYKPLVKTENGNFQKHTTNCQREKENVVDLT